MRSPAKYVLWLTLPLLLAGCDQKKQTAQTQTLAPPIEDQPPPPKPAPVPAADLPPPVVGDTQPAPADTTPPVTPPKKPVRHPKKPATPTTPTTPGTTTPTQEAANPSSSVPAIGQLTGGASGDLASQTTEMINATEKGLNAITRTLNDSETKTAAQIREFLKQAREALATGDADGAHTLALKAKVLLTELNQ